MLHSTWCIIAPPTFIAPSTFLTNRGFFILSILNPFSFAKVVSMNRPVALLSNSAFTATPSWLSSFSSPTFIYTSLSSCNVHRTSLAPSVFLEKFNLLPSFSGCSTLYLLLEASQELTVLHFLLPTLVASPLLLLYFSPNSFRPCDQTSHNDNMFYPLLFLYQRPLHLDLSMDPIGFLLCLMNFLSYFPYSYIGLLPSRLFVPLFPHIILLHNLPFAVHFPLGTSCSSSTSSSLSCSAFDSYLTSPLFLATLLWWTAVLLPLLIFF